MSEHFASCWRVKGPAEMAEDPFVKVEFEDAPLAKNVATDLSF